MAVTAPVSGMLQGWRAKEGAAVVEGVVVALMEALKMETQLLAPRALRQMAAEGSQQKAGAVVGRVEE